MKQDLLSFAMFSTDQLMGYLELAQEVKNQPQRYCQALAGKSVVGLFEKPSLRTRVSFDVGINKLGGHFVYLDSQNDKLGARESLKDMGANLSRWCDAIVARVFSHQTLIELADASSVPVINALCDTYHPCQALADYLTIKETLGDVRNAKIAYIGDGNNVTHSLLLAGALLGADVRVITPKGHDVNQTVFQLAAGLAAQHGGKVSQSHDIALATGCDVIYTDTWISMGAGSRYEDIAPIFMPYQVNETLMQNSGAQFVMHCQPAHREQEITSAVMDGKGSLLLDQAENRMHAQNAILINLLG